MPVRKKLVVREFPEISSAISIGIAALLCCACTVYDPRLLQGIGRGGLEGSDASVTDADTGETADAAIDDCKEGSVERCKRPHAEGSCIDGMCLILRCLDGFADCDAKAANGCEARLDSPEHCGLCGAACRYNRGNAACESGKCVLRDCSAGYGDCDGDHDNGCETDLKSLSDCGACGKACTTPVNSLPSCETGKCAVASCTGPFGDCNESAADGCEQRLNTAQHCGACGSPCAPAHGSGNCDSGSCVVTGCEPGWVNCNGLAADGCETRVDSVDQCGACGASCELPHVTRPMCQSVMGQFRCAIDKGCGQEEPGCKAGAAESGCEPGWSDCDGDARNGCESDLSRISDCGRCKNSCVKVGAVSECRGGQCRVTTCAPGFARCGNETDCRPLAKDPQHCGTCEQTCSDATRNQCAGGRCTDQMCSDGRADCDGQMNNGCETDLNTPQNCGMCGQRCPDLPHARPVCRNGGCTIGDCEQGWRDCDGEVSNGCEVNIRSNSDCGACKAACSAPHADTSCNMNGQCQLTRCDDGRGDCNRMIADGCESDLSLPAHCGACENICAELPDVASSSCKDSSCSLVCDAGRADCNGRSADGCEADLSNPASCGRCGNDCTRLANVSSARCAAGSCTDLVCAPGFADCNKNPADGCERALNTATDCGGCGRACAPAHGRGMCTNGACQLAGCDRGFDNCNNNAADGCETALSTAEHCGTCGTVCAAGTVCNNGRCGCNTDAECGAGNSCCDGQCADTTTACFVWPCLPGTEKPASQANCGGCGMLCPLWCCEG